MANKKALKIMHWNGCGIASKEHEFFNFLDSNKIKIAPLNETFLKCKMRFSHYNYIIHSVGTISASCGLAKQIANQNNELSRPWRGRE